MKKTWIWALTLGICMLAASFARAETAGNTAIITDAEAYQPGGAFTYTVTGFDDLNAVNVWLTTLQLNETWHTWSSKSRSMLPAAVQPGAQGLPTVTVSNMLPECGLYQLDAYGLRNGQSASACVTFAVTQTGQLAAPPQIVNPMDGSGPYWLDEEKLCNPGGLGVQCSGADFFEYEIGGGVHRIGQEVYHTGYARLDIEDLRYYAKADTGALTFRVRSVTDSVWSYWSEPYHITLKSKGKATANFFLSANEISTDQKLIISFEKPADVSLDVYLAYAGDQTQSGVSSIYLEDSEAENNQFIIDGFRLEPGLWRVSARVYGTHYEYNNLDDFASFTVSEVRHELAGPAVQLAEGTNLYLGKHRVTASLDGATRYQWFVSIQEAYSSPYLAAQGEAAMGEQSDAVKHFENGTAEIEVIDCLACLKQYMQYTWGPYSADAAYTVKIRGKVGEEWSQWTSFTYHAIVNDDLSISGYSLPESAVIGEPLVLRLPRSEHAEYISCSAILTSGDAGGCRLLGLLPYGDTVLFDTDALGLAAEYNFVFHIFGRGYDPYLIDLYPYPVRPPKPEISVEGNSDRVGQTLRCRVHLSKAEDIYWSEYKPRQFEYDYSYVYTQDGSQKRETASGVFTEGEASPLVDFFYQGDLVFAPTGEAMRYPGTVTLRVRGQVNNVWSDWEEFTFEAADVVDSGRCWDDCFWTLDRNGVLRVSPNASGSEPEKTWEISAVREAVIGPGVAAVPQNAFQNSANLSRVTIMEGTATIGAHAFSASSLASISLPESIRKIAFGAFFRCASLREITIPEGVETIYNETFYGCSSLKQITLPVSVKSIVMYAFFQSDQLTDVYYQGSETGWNAIAIEESGNESLLNARIHFAETDFTVTYSPNSRYNFASFTDCSVNGRLRVTDIQPAYRNPIVIVTDVGTPIDPEFTGWSLDTAAREPEYTAGDTLTASADLTLYAVWKWPPAVISFDAEGGTMNSADQLTVPYGAVVSLPVPTREGYRFACWRYPAFTATGFYNMYGDTLTATRNYSLYALWMRVGDLNLPMGLTAIEEEAFAGLSVRSVVIPPTVISVESRAFADNPALTDVWIYAGVISIADDAFAGCPNVTLHNEVQE